MKLSFPLILFCSLLQSCFEAVDSPAMIIDKALLTRPDGWVLESAIEETTQTKTDLFQSYLPCVADNIYKLTSDGLYVIHESQTKCAETDPDEKESGNWVLNGSTLILSPAGAIPYQFTISSLSDEKLVCTYLKIGTDGIVESLITITFKNSGSNLSS